MYPAISIEFQITQSWLPSIKLICSTDFLIGKANRNRAAYMCSVQKQHPQRKAQSS